MRNAKWRNDSPQIRRKNIFDYVELTPEIAIYELAVPESWCGKSIIEKSVRTRYHISILATKKDGEMNPLPPPDHIFNKNETLIVMGKPESLKILRNSRAF